MSDVPPPGFVPPYPVPAAVPPAAASSAADSSVRIGLSSNLSYALIAGLVVAIFSMGAYFATQSLTVSAAFASQAVVNASIVERMNRNENDLTARRTQWVARADAADRRDEALQAQLQGHTVILERLSRSELQVFQRMEAMDRKDDVRIDVISKIDNRLTRIEAQLAFLVSGKR